MIIVPDHTREVRMSTLIGKLKTLFLSSAALSPLERSICDAAASTLPANLAELWKKQLNAINRIHRSPDKREVNFFVIRKGQSNFPDELCFKNRSEFKIAVVDLKASGNKANLRARLWCVHGHFFSIEYKTSFREFEEAAHGGWQITCHIETLPV